MGLHPWSDRESFSSSLFTFGDFYSVNLVHIWFLRTFQGYDALLVRSATQVTGAVSDGCRRLKLVGRAGTGTDNIDTQAATKHGVIVMK